MWLNSPENRRFNYKVDDFYSPKIPSTIIAKLTVIYRIKEKIKIVEKIVFQWRMYALSRVYTYTHIHYLFLILWDLCCN